jgi:hypothetical protein
MTRRVRRVCPSPRRTAPGGRAPANARRCRRTAPPQTAPHASSPGPPSPRWRDGPWRSRSAPCRPARCPSRTRTGFPRWACHVACGAGCGWSMDRGRYGGVPEGAVPGGCGLIIGRSRAAGPGESADVRGASRDVTGRMSRSGDRGTGLAACGTRATWCGGWAVAGSRAACRAAARHGGTAGGGTGRAHRHPRHGGGVGDRDLRPGCRSVFHR